MILADKIPDLISLMLSYLGEDLFTYRRYSKKPDESVVKRDCESRVGIIVQGPPLYNNDFTINTLNYYVAFLSSNDVIVYSCWQGDISGSFRSKLDKRIVLVESEKPENPGFRNMNYQIKTVRKGLEILRSLNVDYVMRTRSDQRYYIGPCFNNLLRMVMWISGQDRMLISSFNSFYNRLYSVSDMFQFGTLGLIDAYWNVDLDNRTQSSIKITSDISDIDYARLGVCEQYLMKNFLKSQGFQMDYTYQNYHNAVHRFFYIMDSSALGFIWQKYSSKEARWVDFGSNSKKNNGLIEFSNLHWLSLDLEKRL